MPRPVDVDDILKLAQENRNLRDLVARLEAEVRHLRRQLEPVECTRLGDAKQRFLCLACNQEIIQCPAST
jgi:uncharacterized protein YlxW (UPF0749 family)